MKKVYPEVCTICLDNQWYGSCSHTDDERKKYEEDLAWQVRKAETDEDDVSMSENCFNLNLKRVLNDADRLQYDADTLAQALRTTLVDFTSAHSLEISPIPLVRTAPSVAAKPPLTPHSPSWRDPPPESEHLLHIEVKGEYAGQRVAPFVVLKYNLSAAIRPWFRHGSALIEWRCKEGQSVLGSMNETTNQLFVLRSYMYAPSCFVFEPLCVI